MRVLTQYTQGTVIIDVIDPKSNEVIWRGQGRSAVSDNQQVYLKDLKHAVSAILEEYPRARGVR